MKFVLKAALVACALVLCAANAIAETPTIGLYTDESATNCNLLDTGSGLHQVFVIYTGEGEVTSTEFILVPSDGAALTYLGEAVPSGGGVMGRTDTGIAVVLGGCYGPPTLFLTVQYYGLGVSTVCSKLKILPDPRSTHQNGDMIAYVKCPFGPPYTIDWANPGHITVNPDEYCECEASPSGNPSPAVASTWGGIKALYTN